MQVCKALDVHTGISKPLSDGFRGRRMKTGRCISGELPSPPCLANRFPAGYELGGIGNQTPPFPKGFPRGHYVRGMGDHGDNHAPRRQKRSKRRKDLDGIWNQMENV